MITDKSDENVINFAINTLKNKNFVNGKKEIQVSKNLVKPVLDQIRGEYPKITLWYEKHIAYIYAYEQK